MLVVQMRDFKAEKINSAEHKLILQFLTDSSDPDWS